MVVKFNVKKDVLLGAVRKAAGSWIRTKEMALSVKSDGQGNYCLLYTSPSPRDCS